MDGKPIEIRLEGVSAESRGGRALGAALTRSTLSSLAQIDLTPGSELRLRIPIDWVGFILEGLDREALEQIGRAGGQV